MLIIWCKIHSVLSLSLSLAWNYEWTASWIERIYAIHLGAQGSRYYRHRQKMMLNFGIQWAVMESSQSSWGWWIFSTRCTPNTLFGFCSRWIFYCSKCVLGNPSIPLINGVCIHLLNQLKCSIDLRAFCWFSICMKQTPDGVLIVRLYFTCLLHRIHFRIQPFILLS